MASFDEVKLEDIVHGSFATFNPNTGANKDADSLPTLQVYEEGSSTPLTITSSVTNITTGRYRFQATIAASDGFEAGKYYELWITATVTGTDTVTQSAPLMSFKATTNIIDDLPTVSELNARTLVASNYFNPEIHRVAISGNIDTLDDIRVDLTSDKNEVISSGNNYWTTATGFSTHSAANVWSEAGRTLTGSDNIVSDSGVINANAGTIDHVTLVDTTTTNTDMRGTDNASTFNHEIHRVSVSGNIDTLDDLRVDITSDKDEIISSGNNYWTTATGFATPTNITSGTITTVTNITNPVTLSSTGLDSITQSASGVIEISKAVWDRVLTGDTHNISTSAGRRLRQLGGVNITDGTAQAGTISTITLDAGELAIDHIYIDNLITIIAGTGLGQSRLISEYDGTTKIVTVDRSWDVTPDNTSEYSILAFSSILLGGHGVVTSATSTTITFDSESSAINDAYVGSLVFISSGTGRGETRLITAYAGLTKVATISPAWSTIPDTTSIYKIIPAGRSIVETLSTGAKAEINLEVDAAFSDYDPPTRTELTSDKDEIISSGNNYWTTATGFSTFNPEIDRVSISGTLSVLDELNNLASSDVTALLNNGVMVSGVDSDGVSDIFSGYALTESYAASGVEGTPAQLLYAIQQTFSEFGISGTSVTVRKIDGSTTALTFNLNDDTNPTDRTRAT